jgi:subtilisin-like proprotein convertase family protein
MSVTQEVIFHIDDEVCNTRTLNLYKRQSGSWELTIQDTEGHNTILITENDMTELINDIKDCL